MSLKLSWYSHACVMLETEKTKILVDPFITGNPLSPLKIHHVDADYIFVSHGHGDHVGDTIMIARDNKAVVVANPEVSAWLEAKCVLKSQHIQIGGTINFPWGKVKMTPAMHSSSMPDGSYGGNPAGFIFYIDGKKIYHACDTGLFRDMELIGDEGIDVALLPIGDGYTMGIDDSVKAINFIRPKKVIPVHYNTFEMIRQNPDVWAEKVKKETKAQPIVMKIGDTIEL